MVSKARSQGWKAIPPVDTRERKCANDKQAPIGWIVIFATSI
jgi:hypothetical protein